jgi:hypothetical protein
MSDLHLRFIREQSATAAVPSTEAAVYAALRFQPRLLGVFVLLASVGGFWWAFVLVAALLLFCAIFPRWNPFDAIYNQWIAPRSGVRVGPAPAPRRFAQALASLVTLVVADALALGHTDVARVFEAFILLAIGAVSLFGFCLGSFLYRRLVRSDDPPR